MKKPAPSEELVLRAVTGHVTNYDEAKVGPYALPDPLALPNRERVRDPRTWFELRRPELLKIYETDVFGRVPATTPIVLPEVVADGERVANGAGISKHVIIHFGPGPDGPKADLVLYVPAAAKAPVPVLLQIVFTRGLAGGGGEATERSKSARNRKGPPAMEPSEIGPVDEILRRGYAYATFRYTDIQPDNRQSLHAGVIALAYRPGQSKRASNEWGAITAWAWAASRVLDYLVSDPSVDATRVALIGHSRLGKTALWASALDPRFALVFASCSGEMGAALSRRDYGETIDDIAAHFPWWFAANFQNYIGRWSELPVDAHTLIALCAPRPVFLTGGTQDKWADPRGEFLAAVAAGPVYRLLGHSGLGTDVMPAADTALVSGNLGWRLHTGPHAILPGDWQAFLDFADRHLGHRLPAGGFGL